MSVLLPASNDIPFPCVDETNMVNVDASINDNISSSAAALTPQLSKNDTLKLERRIIPKSDAYLAALPDNTRPKRELSTILKMTK